MVHIMDIVDMLGMMDMVDMVDMMDMVDVVIILMHKIFLSPQIGKNFFLFEKSKIIWYDFFKDLHQIILQKLESFKKKT